MSPDPYLVATVGDTSVPIAALVELPPDLTVIRDRWLELGARHGSRSLQDRLWAEEFAAPFARLFRDLPLSGAPTELERPRALISVLGLSWQPVALMAAWCRPERMLVLATEESLAQKVTDDGSFSEEGVLSAIARVAEIPRDAIEVARVRDPGEEDIYRAVRDFFVSSELPARQIFVDPTGGKKSMSAPAALAAFVIGAPLVYVDYGEYHKNRIPVTGTEYPRLLTNPLVVFGDIELQSAFAAFNRGDFWEAERIAARLAEHMYEAREPECLKILAMAYGKWQGFDFSGAHEALSQALRHMERFSRRGRWAWEGTVRDVVDRNLAALAALCGIAEKPGGTSEASPLLAWYLASARRLVESDKLSQALLLAYAAIERYVDVCLWVDFGLDDENPEYDKITPAIGQPDNAARYEEAGRRLHGSAYRRRDLDGPLMFSNGIQLLTALAPNRIRLEDLGVLRGLAAARNRSEFEHGYLPKPPSRDLVKRFVQSASEIIARGLGLRAEFESAIDDCSFPRFHTRELDRLKV